MPEYIQGVIEKIHIAPSILLATSLSLVVFFEEIHHYLSPIVTVTQISKWCFPSRCRPSFLLKFLNIFSTENLIDSLDDAKVATDLQPSLVKAIISGKIKINVLYVFCRRVFCLAQKLQRSQLSRGRKSLQGGLQGPALYTSRGLIHPLFPSQLDRTGQKNRVPKEKLHTSLIALACMN